MDDDRLRLIFTCCHPSLPSAPTCCDAWGRADEAAPAHEAALRRTENAAERAFLRRSLGTLGRAR